MKQYLNTIGHSIEIRKKQISANWKTGPSRFMIERVGWNCFTCFDFSSGSNAERSKRKKFETPPLQAQQIESNSATYWKLLQFFFSFNATAYKVIDGLEVSKKSFHHHKKMLPKFEIKYPKFFSKKIDFCVGRLGPFPVNFPSPST